MSAPSADFPALGASTSSSGYCDGLGRRALAFDREDGSMLERLVVRAELSAFERSLRDRLERIAALDDERLARPRSIERSHDGALVVLSEFVPGSRLSDLLDSTAHEGSVPGVDVAIGFLLDVLPALCGLHAGAGFAHGAISAGRTVLTPAGQVVLLDGIFGEALSRLQYSRRRLWAEFGVAMPPAAGPPRFDVSCDIAQAALAAVMLVIGRPIAEYEYPESIPALLVEVVDVAQIRGSTEFAAGLQRFLQRSLPLPGRRPYTAVDDALIEVRDLARALGVDVCRRALVDFIEQQETNNQSPAARDDAEYSSPYSYSYPVVDDVTAGSNGEGASDFEVDADGSPLEMDVDLDGPLATGEDIDTFYDLNSGADVGASGDEAVEPVVESKIEEAPADVPAPYVAVDDAEPPLPEPVDVGSYSAEPVEPAPDLEPVASTPDAFEAASVVEEPAPREPAEERELEAAAAEQTPAETHAAEETPPEEAPGPAEAAAPPAEAPLPEESETTSDALQEQEEDEAATSKNSRRRKRARSARSRKDKLRSTARPQPLTPAPPPAPPPPVPRPAPAQKPTTSGWLVEPGRAAAFEQHAPAPVPPPEPPPRPAPPIVLAPPPPPPPPSLPPPAPPQAVAAPPVPRPVLVPPAAPIPVQRTPVGPPPPPTLPHPSPPVVTQAHASTLKLKAEPPAGYAPPRKPRPDSMEDVYGGRPVFQPGSQESSTFPWKIAGGALVLIVVGAIVGGSYLTGGSTPPPKTVPEPELAAPPVTPPTPAVTPKTGRVQITTEPSGARVILDGKHIGESPLTLEVPAGRHTFTFATSSDSVRRIVRVDAGKTLNIDVPIFSGFVDIVAPIILDVAENGKSIGTTEHPRQILRPGKHVLTLSNRDLDYTTVQTVDVEPGEVKTLTIDPRGAANLNATPWAEVWMDGKKIGDTPLANLALPLGTHELIFKHPKWGERRVTTTIRANAPIAVSVDMTKQ